MGGENNNEWDGNVGCLVEPEHEGDGGEKGDDSTKGDVAPRCRRQGRTVQQDVQTIQEVRHLTKCKCMKVGGGKLEEARG